MKLDKIQLAHAEVAELADALGSGLSSRKGVRVQVPPSALKKTRRNAGFLIRKNAEQLLYSDKIRI